MDTTHAGAFGSAFVPGKVQGDRTAASRALRRVVTRWDVNLVKTEGGKRPPSAPSGANAAEARVES